MEGCAAKRYGLCPVERQSELRRCARCKHCRMMYCNAACQKADWRRHKLVCVEAPPTDALGGVEITSAVRERLHCDVVAPPSGQPVHNVLLLLHGVGDSQGPFAALARKMALPYTEGRALQGPLTMPLMMDGSVWLPTFEVDGSMIVGVRGEKRRLKHIRAVRQQLKDEVDAARARGAAVFLLGFAQGAAVAVDAAMALPVPIDGVIAISGGCFLPELLAAAPSDPAEVALLADWPEGTVSQTPLLVMHGARDAVFPIAEARRHFDAITAVTGSDNCHFAEYDRGAGMPASEAEMRRIFEFFAPKLRRPETEALERMAADPNAGLVEVKGIVRTGATNPNI